MTLRPASGPSVPRRTINIRLLLGAIADGLDLGEFAAYLFGSRKDRTGSVRCDVDVLIISERPLTPEHAQQIFETEPYLDVFEVTGGEARSLVNDSRITATNEQELIKKLGAVALFVEGKWHSGADDFELQEVLDQRSPAATSIPMYDRYDAIPSERADILVVTALTAEYEAVLNKLSPDHDFRDSVARIEVADWLVSVRNLNEMGSVGAALGTREAILRTKPTDVVLVGICAGIPGKVSIGDVVIPRTIIYFESAKMTDGGEQYADDQRHCNVIVRNRAAMHVGDLAARGVVLHAGDGLMACGEKVIATEQFRDEQIRLRHRKIVAIDMESYGVATAAEMMQKRLTVIKGVCDYADSRKDDTAHLSAAANAAEVLSTMIAGGALNRPGFDGDSGYWISTGVWSFRSVA